jgi:hypothetical protein
MKISRKPIIQDFKLLCDEDEQAMVTIRQSRTGDTIRRAELFSETTRVWDDDQFGRVEFKQKWNGYEQRRMEAYLTVIGVIGINDEMGNPMFKSVETPDGPRLDMSMNDFFKAWDLLPDNVTKEIHDYVIQVNPHWGTESGE